MSIHILNRSYAILLLATAATFTLGEGGAAGGWAMAALLALVCVKGRLVILDFMDLRRVKFKWRALLLGWLFLVSALIAVAYRIATP